MNNQNVRQYVGARYVPKLVGEWDKSISYENLSIVTYKGNSFTSRQPVPAGVEISNTIYWVNTGNYNAQFEEVNKNISILSETIPNITINVLAPPAGLVPLDNKGISDNTANLNNILLYMESNNLQGIIYFPSGTYKIDGAINVNVRHTTILGENRGSTIFKHSTNSSMLIFNSVNFCYVKNIIFRNTNNNPDSDNKFIEFNNSSYCYITNVSMYDGSHCITLNKSQNMRIVDVQINNENVVADNAIGIKIIDRCVSSRFENIAINNGTDGSNYIGIYSTSFVQDLYFKQVETARCMHSIYLVNSTAINSGDIIITNCICDLSKGTAIRLDNLGTETYKNTNIISDIYITPYADNFNCIRLNNVNNLTLNNCGINNPEKNVNITGVSLKGTTGIIISNLQSVNIYRACVVMDSKYVNMCNCVMTNYTAEDNSIMLSIVESTRVNVNGNMTYNVPRFCGDDNLSDYIMVSNNSTDGTMSIQATNNVISNNL